MRRSVPLIVLLAAAATLGAAPVPMAPPPPAAAILVDNAETPAPADVDFLFRLGMMEGHLMVARELIQAKRPELALPHFGHPVRELYGDISGYLDSHKFPSFERQLVGLEAAAAAAPQAAGTETKYQAVIATIRRARLLAPESLRASVPEMIKLCADTIDAASGEFKGALERGKVTSMVEYHDSRGFVEYVGDQQKELARVHSDPESQGMLTQLRDIVGKAKWIVEPLLPSPTPRASVAQFQALAQQAAEITKKN